tara:strand:- start:125 stop:616 length:492 start_codon:yes stop_codon:yes gene_type:complete
MNKGFSLIELLVVMAIIGILAAAGAVAYNGFLSSSKINATVKQHNEIVKFIKVSYVNCELNNNQITLKNYHGKDYNFNCMTDPGVWRNAFNAHFHGLNWDNSYSTPNRWDANNPSCCLPDNGNTWTLGITALGAVGSYIVINTDIDGSISSRLSQRILDYRLR